MTQKRIQQQKEKVNYKSRERKNKGKDKDINPAGYGTPVGHREKTLEQKPFKLLVVEKGKVIGNKEFSIFDERDLPWKGQFKELKNLVSLINLTLILQSRDDDIETDVQLIKDTKNNMRADFEA